MLALFRIVEADSGSIMIDGIDISSIGLHDIRSKIAMIPQDPILFTGTLRTNLDPFHDYTDASLWEALDSINLTPQIKKLEAGLDSKVSESGSNLSVGTRQLLCLARALLKRSKVLIMDEATASVDYDTDLLIQAAVAKVFSSSTVITVAHRINTIISYDKIMVLKEGKIAEFASPDQLLANEKSIFYSLAVEAKVQAK